MTRARDLSDYGSRAGLAQIRPSSVTVGSGSATVADSGLVTFTTSSSVQLNGVFSATYDNYKLVLNLTAGSGGSLSLNFATGGTANTTSSYNNVTWGFRSGNAAAVDTANEATTPMSVLSALNSGEGVEMNIFNPFASQYTMVNTMANTYINTVGYKSVAFFHGGNFIGTTSFDGIKLNLGTNHTGTVTVYGYKK